MPSLERFFPPIARFFDTNIRSLPNSRLYFFKANSTTLKATFKDKVGDVAHDNPVKADANGLFPPIFLSGLYRVELRDKDNIVQPGWPVDNVGQDSAIVPFAPWSEIVTYNEDDVVTSPDGFWFRSTIDGNLGLDPDDNSGPGGQWELIVIPIAANFTSNVDWATWSDSGTQLSLNIDLEGLSEDMQASILLTDTDDLQALPALESIGNVAKYYWISSSQPANVPVSGGGFLTRYYTDSNVEKLVVHLPDSDAFYVKTKDTTWGGWSPHNLKVAVDLNGGFSAGNTVTISREGDQVTLTSNAKLTHTSASSRLSFSGVVPSTFRPFSGGITESDYVGNMQPIINAVDGSFLYLAITESGSVRVRYFDSSGSALSRTDSGGPISITYIAADALA